MYNNVKKILSKFKISNPIFIDSLVYACSIIIIVLMVAYGAFLFLSIQTKKSDIAEYILSKAIDEYGMNDSASKMRGYVLLSHMSRANGAWRRIERYFKYPDKIRGDYLSNERRVTTIYNSGQVYYSENGDLITDNDKVQNLRESIQEELRYEPFNGISLTLSYLIRDRNSLKYRGEKKVRGRNCHILESLLGEKESDIYYIEINSFRIVSIENTANIGLENERKRTEYYLNEKRIGPFLIPFRITMYENNKLIGNVIIDTMRFEEVPEDIFSVALHKE
ncbi:MAG: hypothetical protein KKH94_10825 [Candidatus Omnitrophica bacterium]|nr:hypothetical protein [Candidatus Omnitrophota bacterium]